MNRTEKKDTEPYTVVVHGVNYENGDQPDVLLRSQYYEGVSIPDDLADDILHYWAISYMEEEEGIEEDGLKESMRIEDFHNACSCEVELYSPEGEEILNGRVMGGSAPLQDYENLRSFVEQLHEAYAKHRESRGLKTAFWSTNEDGTDYCV